MENVFIKTLAQTALFWAAVMLMTFTIGKDDPVLFLLTLFFPYILIRYPLVVYWERKNKKTIYLVEEKLLRWRPVALVSQA
jgi:predicted membrane protein